MEHVLYEGLENGLYDWRFPRLVDRLDPQREITTDEWEDVRGQDAHKKYEAYLPKYDLTIRCDAEIHGNTKIVLEGEPQKVHAFRTMVEREQTELCAAIREYESQTA